MKTRVLLAVWAFASPLGCFPDYDGIDPRKISGQGSASPDGFELVEGQVILVRIEPISSNTYEDYERFDLMELRSENSNLAFVGPAPDIGTFVFAGGRVGQTSVQVRINGTRVDSLPLTIVAQSGDDS